MKNETQKKEKTSGSEISFIAVGDVFVSGTIATAEGLTDNRRDNPNCSRAN